MLSTTCRVSQAHARVADPQVRKMQRARASGVSPTPRLVTAPMHGMAVHMAHMIRMGTYPIVPLLVCIDVCD
jgi:hypothetical protein